MKKILIFTCMGFIFICLISAFAPPAYATEIPTKSSASIYKKPHANKKAVASRAHPPKENIAKPFFTTKYRVCVSKTTVRAGAGTNYSALGTLYKNDIVYVHSFKKRWAKFRAKSRWHYVSKNCIKRVTR